jgi:protein gp37
VGCTRVSAGCDHCYAFALHDKRHVAWKRGRWPDAPAQYHLPFARVQLLPERLEDPLRWRTPRRVFVNSLSDLFHTDVPDRFIRQVFQVMGAARQHTFQILTKRPERMQRFVTDLMAEGNCATLCGETNGETDAAFPVRAGQSLKQSLQGSPPWPLWPNVWLGVSVEDQSAAARRIPYLAQTPAAVRFLSCEPLLGPLDLTPWMTYGPEKAEWCLAHYGRAQPFSWVIVGGESGKHARVMRLEWVRDLIGQCGAAGVAVFVKQLGGQWARQTGARDRHGGDPSEWPEDVGIRTYPAGGCL